MKTKDIKEATTNHYDKHAIFRIQSRYGYQFVRLMTPEDAATADWNSRRWENRNKGKQGFITVISVAAVDAAGQRHEYNDFDFKCHGFVDVYGSQVTSSKKTLIFETMPVNQIICCVNQHCSIVDYHNNLTAHRAEAAASSARERARVAKEKADHEERVTEINGGMKRFFKTEFTSVFDRYDGKNVEISSARLYILLQAAEAAKAAGLVK